MTEKKGFNLNKFYSRIYRRYDLINKLFTFGLDRKWRRITIEKCLEGNPKSILDLCTGTGDLAISLAKKINHRTEIVGYDMNHSMLEEANKKSGKQALEGIRFVQGNAADIPFKDNYFDRITIGFGFRNLTFSNPLEAKHISEIYRVLKPGGRLLILESGVPRNLLVRFFYYAHLYGILIPLGGLLSGNFKAYWYLAHSSSKFYSIPEIKELLKKYGFSVFKVRSFLLGASNLFMVSK
ncbi:MAG TPA: dimethylmenaquinone methyltransferase [Bacteroidales bacterium]|jgi:demethylmenaquinone methyltransferase/2-methoxy-6-polyprenyl-1,4-benzoquinol methylase|nr:dimethylmenaquinone methyltransferase [Bacteroidales bacterium]